MGPAVTVFGLEKWYLDCVARDGAVLIGYAARLRWGLLRLDYGARITKKGDGPALQRQSFSFGRVDEGGDEIAWANDALRVSGTWTGGRRLDGIVVFDGPDGRIEWQCLTANAEVDARVDGEPMRGSGYVERMCMTVPPWRLPFKELRWGRYVGDDRRDSVVWIDTRGSLQRNWTWVNDSVPVEGAVDDLRVRAVGAELLFESSRPLRCENVAATVLGRFRLLAGLLPRGVRSIEEDKRVGSAVLSGDGPASRGSSIYEVVKWL